MPFKKLVSAATDERAGDAQFRAQRGLKKNHLVSMIGPQ